MFKRYSGRFRAYELDKFDKKILQLKLERSPETVKHKEAAPEGSTKHSDPFTREKSDQMTADVILDKSHQTWELANRIYTNLVNQFEDIKIKSTKSDSYSGKRKGVSQKIVHFETLAKK